MTPPNSSPRRRAVVAPTIVIDPIQSIAKSPAYAGVEGDSISRNIIKTRKARPEHGTVND